MYRNDTMRLCNDMLWRRFCFILVILAAAVATTIFLTCMRTIPSFRFSCHSQWRRIWKYRAKTSPHSECHTYRSGQQQPSARHVRLPGHGQQHPLRSWRRKWWWGGRSSAKSHRNAVTGDGRSRGGTARFQLGLRLREWHATSVGQEQGTDQGRTWRTPRSQRKLSTIPASSAGGWYGNLSTARDLQVQQHGLWRVWRKHSSKYTIRR